jgi:hypothetical protein
VTSFRGFPSFLDRSGRNGLPGKPRLSCGGFVEKIASTPAEFGRFYSTQIDEMPMNVADLI